MLVIWKTGYYTVYRLCDSDSVYILLGVSCFIYTVCGHVANIAMTVVILCCGLFQRSHVSNVLYINSPWVPEIGKVRSEIKARRQWGYYRIQGWERFSICNSPNHTGHTLYVTLANQWLMLHHLSPLCTFCNVLFFILAPSSGQFIL